MIQAARIRNFQSHKDTRLEFHPGLNVILGTGDSGKSAILRALRWNQSNRIRHDDRPMGDSYVSDWAKSTSAKGTVTLLEDCSVEVTKPEGTCTRFREAPKGKGDKERNGYEVNGQRFEAIGVSVPDAVSQFFNWSEVNVQRQQDPAFLLSKGAGEVASFLNRTVRLDTIDHHIQAAASVLRERKDAQKLLLAQQEADQKALDALDWVPAMQARIEALEALEAQRQVLRDSIARLREIRERMAIEEARIQRCTAILAMEPRIKECRRLDDWRRGLMDQRRRLGEVRERWTLADRTIERTGRVLALEPRVQRLRELSEECGRIVASGNTIRTLCGRWKATDAVVQRSGRILSLAPRVQALREQWGTAEQVRGWLESLRALLVRWREVRLSPVDWEAMERKALRIRKLWERAEGIRKQVSGIRGFRLTFADLERSIKEAGARASELEAMRPETCPLCGGPMHKEHRE